MKKVLKVLLPSIFLFVFGITLMLTVTSCTEDGSKCSSCISSSDCDYGLSCYEFSNGGSKCAESVGDLCFGF